MSFSLKSLKSYDMFGHLITLNFNLKGNRHKTLMGACFSLFIKFFIWVYIFLTFKTMFEKGANSNTAFESSKPIEEFGQVYYNGTGHVTFYVLRR